MSSSLSKVVFEDGTELFGFGDNEGFRSTRLHTHAKGDPWPDEEAPVSAEEADQAACNAEPVDCYTTYGDGSWKLLEHYTGAMASRHPPLLVRQPSLPPEEFDAWGYRLTSPA